MQVQLTPDHQARLAQLAGETGRGLEELIGEALEGYLGELQSTRALLDRRYDELKSGAVRAVSGEQVRAHLHQKRTDRDR